MDSIDGVPKWIEMLRGVNWKWERGAMEALLLDLGLQQENSNATWTHYHLADGKAACSLLHGDGKVLRLEVAIDVNEELGNQRVYDPIRYIENRDAVFHEFDCKFARAVAQAEAILGPPRFRGTWQDVDCPDRIASPIRVAAWLVRNGILMVEYQHEDNELPLIIAIVIQPELAETS